MKPLPAEKDPQSNRSEGASNDMSALLGNPIGNNKRVPKNAKNFNAYPLMLLLSTATAAIFFVMYITKPYIVQGNPDGDTDIQLAGAENPTGNSNLLPNNNQLPGETTAKGPASTHPSHTGLQPPVIEEFEETNLRMQHILTAKSPNGYTGRIDVDVPVLYQSRQLRWSASEVSEARSLLAQLNQHRDKTNQLRNEGAQLLKQWDQLISKSIPPTHLRADSPSTPENQHSAVINQDDEPNFTADSIQTPPSE